MFLNGKGKPYDHWSLGFSHLPEGTGSHKPISPVAVDNTPVTTNSVETYTIPRSMR